MLMRNATSPSAARAAQGMEIETATENDWWSMTGVAPAMHKVRLSTGAAGPKRRKCQRPTELTALTEIPQFCSLKFPTPGRFRT